MQLRCVCPGQTTELNFCVSKLLAGAVPWKPAMSESASSSMGFTICSLKISLLTLRADIKADSMEGSHFLWTFTKKYIHWNWQSWGDFDSNIAHELHAKYWKRNVNFPIDCGVKTGSPVCSEMGCFVPGDTGTKKKTFKALRSNSSVPVPDTAGPQMAPEWHNPGSLPFLGEAGVLFNLFLILSLCIFTDTSRPLSASPKMLCYILSSWQVHWFTSWSFQDRGMGLWLCFSGSSLTLLATMHSPPQPLLEHCGCSWALSLEHNYRIHT